MKRFLLFIFIFLLAITSYGQNKTLGVGVVTPNPNAALHVESPTSNQGFIMPRLTTVQRNGMGSLLTASDNGLMLYDTDLKAIYIWDGVAWISSSQAASLSLPLVSSTNSAAVALDITNIGTGSSGKFSVNNPASPASALLAETNGTGSSFLANKTGNGQAGRFVKTNGTGPAVYIDSQSGGGLFANHNGPTGYAGIIQTINIANTSPGLYAESAGTGASIWALKSTDAVSGDALLAENWIASGSAGKFSLTDASNGSPALFAETNGTGNAIQANINNVSSNANAVAGLTNGTGIAVYGENTGGGNGFGGLFLNTNATNTYPAIQAGTAGSGTGVRVIQNATSAGGGMDVIMQNTTGTALGFSVDQQGLGSAGNFNINNASSSARAVNASTNGTGAAIFGSTSTGYSAVAGQHNGTSNGFGGLFEVTNATNTFQAIKATSVGTGGAARFETNNAAGTNPNIESVTNASGGGILSTSTGTGYAGNFNINNVSSGVSALNASTNGTAAAIQAQTDNGFAAIYGKKIGATFGTGVQGDNDGTLGTAGTFRTTNAANPSVTLDVSTIGTGHAGNFNINNALNASAGLHSATNGTGAAIIGETGTGFAAIWAHKTAGAANEALNAQNDAPGGFAINSWNTNAANTFPAILIGTAGTGTVLVANHTGASGNIATFQSSDLNVARIDKTGKGFFNGGTQASGADVAEMFDVEGERQNYEPGDVLVISEISDRTVEKSSTTNSTKVIGVYATKPGVVLTEKGIDENLDQLVPMGVIGVIPTKVCLENGAIKRGDLLVTSSKSGHAMKAISIKGDGVFPAGVIIGKALENFESGESGLIKVLVNVK